MVDIEASYGGWCVTRYTPGYETDESSYGLRLVMDPDENGEWVRYSDYTTLLQEVETLREQLARHEEAAPQDGKLPDFDDLPDDVHEEMEMALYTTVSDEDHWGADVAENIYEVVRRALRKRGPLSQEWVTKATSSGEDEPPVLGAGISPPPQPAPQDGETKV